MGESRTAPDDSSIRSRKAQLKAAQQGGDARQLCIAEANLAAAYLLNRNLKKGREHFEEAESLLERIDDLRTEVEVLQVRSFAQQVSGQYPDAYQAAERLQEIGEQLGDRGIECDALASQGQIQLDSGDPVAANDRLQRALALARQSGDRRREMSVIGALGNVSLAVASTDQALQQFRAAREMAVELQDDRSEHGFIGTIGTLLAFQGDFQQAVEHFTQVMDYARSHADLDAQIQALRYLCQSFGKLEQHQQVVEYAKQGVALATAKDRETAIFFLEELIGASYALGAIEQAEAATQQALALAGKLADRSKWVSLMVSLGESLAFSNRHEQALEIYGQALEQSVDLHQARNQAYLTGRIGFSLAELGRLDEAIQHHQRAVELAQRGDLGELEAEQLSMLAIAHLEQGDPPEAEKQARLSLQRYSELELDEDVQRVRELLAQIEAAAADAPADGPTALDETDGNG